MKIGYARVSTAKQDLDVQVAELKKAGVDKIYKEKYTGTSMDRPVFDQVLASLQKGDTLVVTKLDRLARNTKDALNIVETLRNNKVTLHILNMGVIDDTPIGNLVFTVFSAFAEFERDLIVARTKEGKEWAKQHDPNYADGRPRVYEELQVEHAYHLKQQGYSYTQIEKLMGMNRASAWRLIREYEATHELNDKEKKNHDQN